MDYKHNDDPQAYHGEPAMKKSKKSHVGHKVKGVDRGIINVVNAPVNPKVRAPEKTVKFGSQVVQLRRLRDEAGVLQTVVNHELSPGAWSVNSAPLRGTGKNERIKDSINIRSWVMRIKSVLHTATDDASPGVHTNLLTGDFNVRFLILQILDDKAAVLATAANGYTYDKFMADSGEAMSWFESQNRSITAADNKGHRYKVILDHSWPNVTRDHYEEIKLGPHVQTYDPTQNSNNVMPVVGRFIAFFVFRCDNPTGQLHNFPVAMTIEHRMTYTDE